MMNKGDQLEWKTVHGICRGIVTESENGELICKVDAMTAFPLKDIIQSSRLQDAKGNNIDKNSISKYDKE